MGDTLFEHQPPQPCQALAPASSCKRAGGCSGREVAVLPREVSISLERSIPLRSEPAVKAEAAGGAYQTRLDPKRNTASDLQTHISNNPPGRAL